MKKYWFTFLIISSVVLSSCSDDNMKIDPKVEGTEITKFEFLKSGNPKLTWDSYATIENGVIHGRLPWGVDMTNLVASFDHTGASVRSNNQAQISGETSNDFSTLQIYEVSTNDSQTGRYEVDMTYFTGLPIIYLQTDNNDPIDSKESYFTGSISMEGGRYFDDMNSTGMKIRGRGNSTWGIHPKKPFQLKFSDKTSMLGMPEDKKWIFFSGVF